MRYVRKLYLDVERTYLFLSYQNISKVIAHESYTLSIISRLSSNVYLITFNGKTIVDFTFIIVKCPIKLIQRFKLEKQF